MRKTKLAVLLLLGVMLMCVAFGCGKKSAKKELEEKYREEFITSVTDVIKVESMQSTGTIIIAVVVYVISCLVVGYICSEMAERCGLESKTAFAKGFFFNVIGLASCANDCIGAMTYQINILKAEKEK